jgi:zinc protease
MKPVRVGILRNGFRFYTQHDAWTHLVGVGVMAGSMYDPPGMSGMAHLTEHVVCRGLPGISDRDLELKFREYGCGPREDINIHTMRESTFYGADALARRAQALELFPYFAAMVRRRVLDPKILETELAAAYNEYLHHGEDSTEDMVDVLMHKLMYERNPARQRIDCEPEDLKQRITPNSMEEFIRQWYVANNMFAVILGPSYNDARRLAQKHFGDLEPRVDLVRPTTDEMFPVLSGIKSITVERQMLRRYPDGTRDDLKLWHMGIGFPTHPLGHVDDEAIDILTEILQFRAEEVLREQNNIVDEGTYHPFVQVSRTFLHGLFYLWFETPTEKFALEGEERFIRECEKVKRWGVDQNELDRAVAGLEGKKRVAQEKKVRRAYRRAFEQEFNAMRNKQRNGYISAFEFEPGALCSMIIEAAANGDEDVLSLNTYRDRLKRVTRSRVVAAANRYLTTPDRYARVVVRPFL